MAGFILEMLAVSKLTVQSPKYQGKKFKQHQEHAATKHTDLEKGGQVNKNQVRLVRVGQMIPVDGKNEDMT